MNNPTLAATMLPNPAYAGNSFVLRGLHLLRAYQSRDGDSVRRMAKDYLRAAEQNRRSNNYGNAIHQAHIVLGLIALENAHLEKAERHLAAAALTPGSSQLKGLGPNMLLAKKLLEAGRRSAVLQYLDDCGKFWRLSMGRIWKWKLEIRAGRTPNFGANLSHLLDPKSFG